MIQMRKFSARRMLSGFVVTALCAAATVVASAAPANAAASGYLLMKGTGSVYTSNEIVNQGGIPGGTAKVFGFRIVNTGSASQQFKVTLPTYGAGTTATLLLGSTVLPKPYYTAPIAPGGTLSFTVKVSVPAGAPQGEYIASFELRDPETNAVVDTASADVNATYQTGNTGHDLFLKTGTQPFVGGGTVTQFETASPLKVGSSALFTLRLQNDSGSPRAITLASLPLSCASDFTVVVKQGTTNVTAAVANGTYSTGVLAPGARKELKVTVKMVAASACTGNYLRFGASGSDGSISQYAHIVTAA